MPDELDFPELMRRVRRGDARAAEELLHRFEPHVRRVARVLLSPPLRTLVDSMDVGQQVFGSFFVRAALGEWQDGLKTPADLARLLGAMARNKVANEARRHGVEARRLPPAGAGERTPDPPDPHASPSQLVAWQELLAKARERLTPEERRLGELRAAGLSWAAIAAEVGGTAEAVRVRLARARARVFRELGLLE